MDLDESYAPRAEPTLFGKPQLPGNLSALEGPRLSIHSDQLYLLAFGLNLSGRWHRRQWLALLERLPAAGNSEMRAAAAGSAAPAGFRLVQPRMVLLPENLPAELILPRYMDIRDPAGTEKIWVPFSYMTASTSSTQSTHPSCCAPSCLLRKPPWQRASAPSSSLPATPPSAGAMTSCGAVLQPIPTKTSAATSPSSIRTLDMKCTNRVMGQKRLSAHLRHEIGIALPHGRLRLCSIAAVQHSTRFCDANRGA